MSEEIWEDCNSKFENFLILLNTEWDNPDMIQRLLNDQFRKEKMRIILTSFISSLSKFKNILFKDLMEENISDIAENLWINPDIECPLYFVLLTNYISNLFVILFDVSLFEEGGLLKPTKFCDIIKNFKENFKSKESFVKFFRYIDYFLKFIICSES